MRVKELLWAGALVVLGHGNVAAQTSHGFLDRVVTVRGHEYRYKVYVPKEYSTASPWPVVLFLHGAGERGSDGSLQTSVGLGPAVRQNPERFPAIVVFPQAPTDSTWAGVSAEMAMAALRQTEREFRTDPDRVYLTGISMGGHGTWYIAYRDPDRFAAIAPICGWVTELARLPVSVPVVPPADGLPFTALADRVSGVPTWIFHGDEDAVVPVEESRNAADALKARGADVRYTEFSGVSHNAWSPAYALPEFSTWLLEQRRGRE